MADGGQSFSIGYHLVALIDVLNQKDELRKLTDLPTSPEEHERFIETLQRTYGVVDTFRALFANFFTHFMKDSSGDFPLTPQQREAFADLQKTVLKIQRFADTVIVYVPLRTDTTKVPMNGVYAALLACGATFLTMLMGRLACRGGIDIGLAAELHEGEIYGPALYSAYDLERTVAQYPRIVVGRGLIDYLDQHAQRQGEDILAQYTRALAKRCRGLLATDIDGCPFLDILGDGYERAMGGEALKDIVPKAHAFVLDQAHRAQENKNSKLAFRYALLKQYFDARRTPAR